MQTAGCRHTGHSASPAVRAGSEPAKNQRWQELQYAHMSDIKVSSTVRVSSARAGGWTGVMMRT